MKKITSLTLFMMISSIIFISSCAKEEENPPVQSGSLIGNWAVNENSHDFGPSTYNVVISDTASNIQIAFLYSFSQKTFVLVSGNSLTIPSQVIQGTNVTGGGVITSPTRIDMTYYVQSTALHYDTIAAVLNKL